MSRQAQARRFSDGEGCEDMEQLRAIYRILRILQRSMDAEEFDSQRLSPEALGISDAMWRQLMRMLVKKGYVDGVRVIEYDQGELPLVKYAGRPTITLEGLEYLEENETMRRMMELAKDIRAIFPG